MAPSLRLSSLVALLSLLAQVSAAGQQVQPLSPGMRARIKVEAVPSAKGTVVSVGSTTFDFRPDRGGDTITIEYSRVRQLDVSRGLHHRIVRNAIIFGLAGLAIGGIVGAASHADFPSPVVVTPPPGPGEGGPGCSVLDPTCTEPPDGPQQPVISHREPTGADAERTARSAGVGAIIGVVAGALVGRMTKSEVWKRMPKEHYQIHVAGSTLPERALSVRLSFAM